MGSTLSHSNDDCNFQCVTVGIRKPKLRFRLATGREVELLSLHLEPGWNRGNQPIFRELMARLYSHGKPVFVGDIERHEGPAFLCVADLFSNTPVHGESVGTCSRLLVCAPMANIDKSVRNIVCELLSAVDRESQASNDVMW